MGRFADLASTLESIRATAGKNEKVRILSDYLRGLDADDAERAARFSTGRASQKGSADETQIGYSTITDVIEEVTGLSARELSRVYVKHGDLGEVAEEIMTRRSETTLFQEELSLADVADSFEAMTQAKGKGSNALKKGYLKALLLRANETEAKYIVKILTKEMRIGLVDGLVEEAVARAFELDRASVREAHLLLGDIGMLARQARAGTIGDVRLELMRPTNFMLAEPMDSPDEISSYFGKEVYADYKYDGVRAQLHKRGDEVRVYSRRLEEITASFPELVEGARRIDHDLMIDGEIVPFRDGRPLSFQLLQRRLRRIEDFEDARSRAPVVFFCFDILLLDGEELYRRPLRERRESLARVIEGSRLHHGGDEAGHGRGADPEALQEGPHPRVRGPRPQGPREPVHTRQAREVLGEAEGGAGHPRRGHSGSRARARQAGRDNLGLHLRHQGRAGPQGHREGVLGTYGQGDSGDDGEDQETSRPRTTDTSGE